MKQDPRKHDWTPIPADPRSAGGSEVSLINCYMELADALLRRAAGKNDKGSATAKPEKGRGAAA